MATREGGSEWEPIKILSEENSAYVPKSLPNVLHTCCQDHVAITVLLTLGTTQQLEHSKQAAENNLSTRTPWGGQTGLQGRLDRLGSGHPYTTCRVTRPQHTGSPVQKQRQTGSPVQLTPGHPSNHSDAQPGPGWFDRLPGAVRPPPLLTGDITNRSSPESNHYKDQTLPSGAVRPGSRGGLTSLVWKTQIERNRSKLTRNLHKL